MTDQYTQVVEFQMSKTTRLKQLTSIGLFGVVLVLLVVGAAVNWYVVIPAVVFIVAGGIVLHNFNNCAKEYSYDYNHERLVVTKKDVTNRQKRMLTVVFDDVVDFGILQDLPSSEDIIACANAGDIGVYELSFHLEDGSIKKLLFLPDDYMIALINERLNKADSSVLSV